jgi:PPOX class probable F420-dependent enzyme
MSRTADTFSQTEERFVHAQRVARMATADAEGHPLVIPICFAFVDGRLYTAVDEKPKSGRPLRRIRNIEVNPYVAIVFDRYDDWNQLAWVLVRGTAALVADGVEKAAALVALRDKYDQYRLMALEERAMIRVTPEQVRSWGAF